MSNWKTKTLTAEEVEVITKKATLKDRADAIAHKLEPLHIESDGYAWSQCTECGNTIKFGPGNQPGTVCPACGCRFSADRVDCTVTLEYVPSDAEFWAEQDADLW